MNFDKGHEIAQLLDSYRVLGRIYIMVMRLPKLLSSCVPVPNPEKVQNEGFVPY